MAWTDIRLGAFDAVTKTKHIGLVGGGIGVRQVLSVMATLVKTSFRYPQVKQVGVILTSGRSPQDISGIIDAISNGTKNGFRYIRDTRGVEEISTPLVHSIRYLTQGQTWGDCDDAAVWQAAIVKSVGLIPRFVAIGTGSDPTNRKRLNHVFCEVLDKDYPGPKARWVSLDFINPNAPRLNQLIWRI
jgi:hypothetical protein